jgi:acetyltransferase
MESDEVDAVVPVLLQRSALMQEVTDVLVAASKQARERGLPKPIHVCWVAPRSADANRERLRTAGIPCHEWPIAAASVLAATISKPSWPLAQPSKWTPVAVPDSVDKAGWVGSGAALCLLQQAGFPVARWAVAADPAQAAAAARDLKFPVVLKAERQGLVHKSEADAVRLGLRDGVAVVAAFEDFCRRLG